MIKVTDDEGRTLGLKLPEVAIYPSAFVQILHYVRLASPEEISGMGKVEIKNGVSVITEVIYRGGEDQVGFTQITKAMSDYMRELIAKDPENADQELAKVHFWWHSHAEGGVFWSGTDEETNQRGITSRYLISMVVNTSQQYRTRLTFFEPSLCWFDNLDLKWYIGPEDSISTAEAIKLADEQWKIFHRKPFFQRIFGSVLRKGTGEANTGFGSGLGTTSGGVKIPPMSNIPPPPIVPPPSVIPDPTKKEE